MAASFQRAGASPVLVGRERAVAALAQWVQQTQAGQGQVVTLVGEAGLGKTRLVQEARALGEARGFAVLQGQCYQHDSALAYGPLLDLLQACFAAVTALEALPPLERALVQAVPEAAPLLPLPPDPAMLSPAHAQRRRFTLLTQFFLQRAAQQPTLVILEDLHWGDESSLAFVLHLIRHSAGHALLLMLTYRPDERPPLRDWQAELDRTRRVHEIVLPPLDRHEVGQLAQALADVRLSLETVERIYALSEGNPFAVEELLAAVQRTADAERAESLPLPRTARAATQQRLTPLAADTRRVLTLASALGRQFDFALLQHLAGGDEPSLLAHLKTLIAAGLLVEAGPDSFAFRHALTRAAVYEELLARERRGLHQVIAETLMRLHAGRLEARLAELSYHYYEAADWPRTLEFARQAGEQAQALHAPRAAAQHYGRALEAARQLGYPAVHPLHRARGQAYETLGDFEAARRDFEASLALARSLGDRTAEWQALLDLGGLWASRDYARTGAYYQAALALARAAADPARVARSLNYLGNWQVNTEAPESGRRLHEEALAVFESQAHQSGIAQTLDLLGMDHFLSGNVPAAERCLAQATSLFQQLNQRPGLVLAKAIKALCVVGYQTASFRTPLAPVAEGVRTAEAALRLAQEIDFHAGEAFALNALAFNLGAAGEYTRSLEAGERALAVAQEIDHRQWTIMAHCALGAVLTDLFALPAAVEHLAAAFALAPPTGSKHWLRTSAGFLAAAQIRNGQLAEAESVLRTAMDEQMPARTIGQRLCWSARAELALAHGEAAAALALAGRLAAEAEPGDGPLPHVAVLRGAALARLGRWEEAAAAQQPAAPALEARGAWGLLWPVQAALAATYAAQGQADLAGQVGEAARSLAATLAANVPAGPWRAAFEAGAAARFPAAPASKAARLQPGSLTRREREVAALIAQGKSNREIAAALVVSERTAESHVSNILNKLGFTTRAQVAAWSVEAGVWKPDRAP